MFDFLLASFQINCSEQIEMKNSIYLFNEASATFNSLFKF